MDNIYYRKDDMLVCIDRFYSDMLARSVEMKRYLNKDEVVKTIHTGLDGLASTSNDLLLYGKYRLVESQAPVGYLTQGAVSRDFEINENEEIVDLTRREFSIYNQTTLIPRSKDA